MEREKFKFPDSSQGADPNESASSESASDDGWQELPELKAYTDEIPDYLKDQYEALKDRIGEEVRMHRRGYGVNQGFVTGRLEKIVHDPNQGYTDQKENGLTYVLRTSEGEVEYFNVREIEYCGPRTDDEDDENE